MDLQGKNVLITGAARRIGREIALTLARRGAIILIHFNRSRDEALRLKKEIETAGEDAFLVGADFSFRKKPLLPILRSFVQRVYRLVPRVDVLVNNAAVFYPAPFGRIEEKDWDDFLTVNLKIPFFLSQEIGKRMLKQKSGKIINLTDWTGFRPHPKYLPYAISKAGLSAATIGLARALAPHVQVVSVAPGPILPFEGMKREEKRRVVQKTLLKRFGDPKDIAEAVRFFVEDTDYITGAFLPVDGGSLIA